VSAWLAIPAIYWLGLIPAWIVLHRYWMHEFPEDANRFSDWVGAVVWALFGAIVWPLLAIAYGSWLIHRRLA
jgi:hypothetical protein